MRGCIVIFEAVPAELMTTWARHMKAASGFLDGNFAFGTFIREE